MTDDELALMQNFDDWFADRYRMPMAIIRRIGRLDIYELYTAYAAGAACAEPAISKLQDEVESLRIRESILQKRVDKNETLCSETIRSTMAALCRAAGVSDVPDKYGKWKHLQNEIISLRELAKQSS